MAFAGMTNAVEDESILRAVGIGSGLREVISWGRLRPTRTPPIVRLSYTGKWIRGSDMEPEKFILSAQHALQDVIPVVKMMFQRREDMERNKGEHGLAAPFVNEMKVDAEIRKQRNLGEPEEAGGCHAQ